MINLIVLIALYAQSVSLLNTPALLHMALISDEHVAGQVDLQKPYNNNNNNNNNNVVPILQQLA